MLSLVITIFSPNGNAIKHTELKITGNDIVIRNLHFKEMWQWDDAGAQYDAWLNEFPSAQYFAAGFIEDYSAELEKHRTYVNAEDKRGLVDSVIAEYLVDIGDYEDFDAGNIVLPDSDLDSTVSIYSSGAITTKQDTTFSIVRGDNTDALTSLLTSDSLKDMDAGNQWVGSVDANGKETK